MSDVPPGRGPGLQPERTLLAWRRTALSLALASAVAVRLTLESYGSAAAAIGVGGVLLAGASYLVADRRYRATRRSDGPVGRLAGVGAPAFLLTVTTLVVGLMAALYVSSS